VLFRSLSLFTDFESFSAFKPSAIHESALASMLDQVVSWGGALKTVRTQRVTAMPVRQAQPARSA
jgi:alpha/beta superfamily hydrolase